MSEQSAQYVRHPEYGVDELRQALEGMTVAEIAARNPGIDTERVRLQRANDGSAWTARRVQNEGSGS